MTSPTSWTRYETILRTAQGTADTMSEVMDRLKSAMDENKVLAKSVATLTETNKQLVETIKALGGKTPATPAPTNKTFGKCTICDKFHKLPERDHCHSLEKNKHLKEAYEKRKAEKGTGK